MTLPEIDFMTGAVFLLLVLIAIGVVSFVVRMMMKPIVLTIVIAALGWIMYLETIYG